MQFEYSYGDLPMLEHHKAWAEISVDALKHNYKELVKASGECVHIAVVKADAYGHHAAFCVPALLECGCRFFAVSCIEEAISVREICNSENTDANILILGYTDPKNAQNLSKYNLIQTLLSLEYAEKLGFEAKKAECTVRAHIATDTGMNRIGIRAQNNEEICVAVDNIEAVTKINGLSVEGMFTHFYSSDGEDERITTDQAERFVKLKNMLEERNIKLFCHVSNSAGSVRFPQYSLDGVRLGIMLYGITPSEYVPTPPLRPVMSLKTVIAHIHKVNKGERISYGGDYCAESDIRVATLPVGYADGLIRRYTGAKVTVNNGKSEFQAKIIGRICMDQCMIDVTDLQVSVGDTVTIFGNDADELSALAKRAGTIEYECLTLISSRIPRLKK